MCRIARIAPLILLVLTSSFCRTASAAGFVWDKSKQGEFVTSLLRDSGGRIWVGVEDYGVWRFDPAARKGQEWTHFTTKDGLGDDNAYALVEDAAGCVWVGHLNHGVSVYDGKRWRNYGVTDGPLGVRVFAMAVSPKDGDVWIGTDMGLSRYSARNRRWTHITRAEGLPSDQISALAFDAFGDLFVGTACHGLVIGHASRQFADFRAVEAPADPADGLSGSGLPSNQINAVLVTRAGVWVATSFGVGLSTDHGEHWSYVRGKDWPGKVAGRAVPGKPPAPLEHGVPLLEDYVTCLCELPDGSVWIGHRQWGLESRRKLLSDRLAEYVHGDGYVTAVARDPQLGLIVGKYGSGVEVAHIGIGPDTRPVAKTHRPVPQLPVSDDASSVIKLAEEVKAANIGERLGRKQPVCFEAEDWITWGDSIGRYGREDTCLCAIASPFDQAFSWSPAYRINGRMGPHHRTEGGGDSIRHYMTSYDVTTRKALYTPVSGLRIQSEWDDHGETYPMDHEGPDVVAWVTVPAGIHRVALEFRNKDGHDGMNRFRDYLIRVYAGSESLQPMAYGPELARARVRMFWGPVYERFLVSGPASYRFVVGRNYSYNAIVSGVFIDKVRPGGGVDSDVALPHMGGVKYGPPRPENPAFLAECPAATASRELWDGVQALRLAHANAAGLSGWLRLAYRATHVQGGPPNRLAAWRWQLGFWNEAERQVFSTVMREAYTAELKRRLPPPPKAR